MSHRRVIVWDFDGTLGHRRHGTWAECLMEILDRQQPGHPFTRDRLFTALATGFPWHEHQRPHPHLADPDRWWNHITSVVTRALVGLGAPLHLAESIASHVRAAYREPTAWSLYPQTTAVLQMLTASGWDHVILSNHVPELPAILDALRLMPYVYAVVNSARTGFEKPHPQAFELARAAAAPAPCAYMVGDNPQADVAGAQAAGLHAIWVRRDEPSHIPDLHEAARLILRRTQEPNSRPELPRTWEVAPLDTGTATRTASIR
ncbi:HAD family hydrolase [Streptomyces sp. NPDC000405]|uniref:HAD family hydrolase n=1 Tax=Streptomyces sp. NPDC000405 TaxID=3161033 RepID=UPI00398CAC83